MMCSTTLTLLKVGLEHQQARHNETPKLRNVPHLRLLLLLKFLEFELVDHLVLGLLHYVEDACTK